MNLQANFKKHCKWAKSNLSFGGILRYRLRPEIISPLLQTFLPLRMFKIVFRDSALYPKPLHLFCLLRLISASADFIGYFTNFCITIELLHELNNNSCQRRGIQAFDNVSAGKKEN